MEERAPQILISGTEKKEIYRILHCRAEIRITFSSVDNISMYNGHDDGHDNGHVMFCLTKT